MVKMFSLKKKTSSSVDVRHTECVFKNVNTENCICLVEGGLECRNYNKFLNIKLNINHI